MTATAQVVTLTTSQQAAELRQEAMSKNAQAILHGITMKIKGALPDNDSPETCWDLCMKICSKYPPVSEIEFRAIANRASAILAQLYKRGEIYRTRRQSMASVREDLGFGVAKRSSYGYAHRLGSQIRPGANADNNPAKAAKAEAERRDKAVENQSADLNETLDKVLDIILGLKYHDLKAIRELVDTAMDDCHNALIMESASNRGFSNDKYEELKAMLAKQQETLEELQQS